MREVVLPKNVQVLNRLVRAVRSSKIPSGKVVRALSSSHLLTRRAEQT